jgi:hypothetical protein
MKENFKNRLNEIIETSFQFLEMKIANGGIISKNEASFQLEFGNEHQKIKSAIELRFLKNKNHREPNNRYAIFKDISNFEAYKENGIDLCYFYISTDHSHYVNQEIYSIDTADFDFRDGFDYKKRKILNYNTENLMVT